MHAERPACEKLQSPNKIMQALSMIHKSLPSYFAIYCIVGIHSTVAYWHIFLMTLYDGFCSEDESNRLNGSEPQERRKDRHRSLEADKTSRGRESDPEKAARNSRNEDAVLARSLVRERVRPSDGDVVGNDRVWSPQQEEVIHEKVRIREEGATRGRRSKTRMDEAVLKVWLIV